MRVLFFGTYDVRSHPRVRVLQEGFRAHGDDVVECNLPLGLDTAWRVRILRRPWLVPVLMARVGRAWMRLWRKAARLDQAEVVVVGYMGHFDVHLARRLWPRSLLVLDHLISASDTAKDRGIEGSRVNRVLQRIDDRAVDAADIVAVDTPEHFELLPQARRARAVVVPVGAPQSWFRAPERRDATALRVVFFGLYTPLQGTPVIGEALRLLAGEEAGMQVTMIGRGQDLAVTKALASVNSSVRWLDWVSADELPGLVAAHDVCLGIFGSGPKARRVVPNKVFQGAAAGCAIVTSDTQPQRTLLADAGCFVPCGDARALAQTLRVLAEDPDRLWAARTAAFRHAEAVFRPAQVIQPLRESVSRRLVPA